MFSINSNYSISNFATWKSLFRTNVRFPEISFSLLIKYKVKGGCIVELVNALVICHKGTAIQNLGSGIFWFWYYYELRSSRTIYQLLFKNLRLDIKESTCKGFLACQSFTQVLWFKSRQKLKTPQTWIFDTTHILDSLSRPQSEMPLFWGPACFITLTTMQKTRQMDD